VYKTCTALHLGRGIAACSSLSVQPACAHQVKGIGAFIVGAARLLVMSVMLCGALISLLLVVLTARHLVVRGGSPREWLAVLPFLAMAGILGWLAYREVRSKKAASVGSSSLQPFQLPPDFHDELFAELRRLDSVSVAVLIDNFNLQVQKGQFDETLRELSRLQTSAPDNWALTSLIASVHFAGGRFDEAARSYHSLVLRTDLPAPAWMTMMMYRIETTMAAKAYADLSELADLVVTAPVKNEEKTQLLDILACKPLMFFVPIPFEQALQWIVQARALDPESLTLKGTHAALLVETGNMEEAAPMLGEILQCSRAPIDLGISMMYQAIIQFRQGDLPAAIQSLNQARRHHFEPWMEQRIENEGLTQLEQRG
jgi:Flp pilus assembly protein TadD